MEGRFDASIFRPVYQRNNKRGGLKNLRCFPSCSEEHRVRGFCGRSVVVTFRSSAAAAVSSSSSSPSDSPPSPEKLRCFVEFEEDFVDPYKYPNIVDLEFLQSKLRTKVNPTNPSIEGTLRLGMSANTIVFEFNQERRGWHYGWVSNKHVCETKHRLVCRLYEEIAPNTFKLLSSCMSPEFVLFCRRRRRYQIEPTAKVISSSSTKRRKSKGVQDAELATTVMRIETARDESDATLALLSLVSSTGSSSASSSASSSPCVH